MKKIILILFAFLFFTQTSEAQWYVQQSGTTNPLYDIEFINRSTGWSCGDGGYIIKTTNGGENWIQQGEGGNFMIRAPTNKGIRKSIDLIIISISEYVFF